MSASESLGRQFRRTPLGGPGGIEDRLRQRDDWEKRQLAVNPRYPQGHLDAGAAMIMDPHYRPPWWDKG